MSSKVVKDNSRGKMYDVSRHRLPHSSKKRIRRNPMEKNNIDCNISFNEIGIFSAIFVGFNLPLSIEWRIGLAILYLISSIGIHISKGEEE